MRIEFTILGEAASKANSREIVQIAGRPSSIKSKKARDYEADAVKQIPPACRVQLDCPVRVTLHLYYKSQRPDLDESVVLDVLQDRYRKGAITPAQKALGIKAPRVLVQKGVIRNDRLVREKHVFFHIDKANPRAHIVIEPIGEAQVSLDMPTPRADPLEV